jgi:Zn-dependent protease with chaperone function
MVQQLREIRRFLRSLPPREPELPARLQCLAAELGITARVDLVRDVQAYSFCYGFLRPRICVTTGLLDLLDEAELRALLLHERHHLRQRDPLRILIARVVGDAINLLPIAGMLVRQYRVAQEVAADQAAIAGCDSEAPLSSALLKLLTINRTRARIPIAVGAFSVTEERIARLVYGERAMGGALTGAWAATILMLVGTLLMGYAGLASMQLLSALPVECMSSMAPAY